jgi:hypothetical protein
LHSRSSNITHKSHLLITRLIWNSPDLELNYSEKLMSKLCYGQSVLVSSTHLGLTTRFLLLSDNCGFVDVGRSLRRENGSAVYNCCWSSPAQLFLGPTPAGLMTIFYCLRFETPPTWRVSFPYLYPPGTGWPSYGPRHWVPFSSPPTTRRATVVSELLRSSSSRVALYNIRADRTENPVVFLVSADRTENISRGFYCCVSTNCHRDVFTSALRSNGSGLGHIENSLSAEVCLPSRCLAMLWANPLQYKQ